MATFTQKDSHRGSRRSENEKTILNKAADEFLYETKNGDEAIAREVEHENLGNEEVGEFEQNKAIDAFFNIDGASKNSAIHKQNSLESMAERLAENNRNEQSLNHQWSDHLLASNAKVWQANTYSELADMIVSMSYKSSSDGLMLKLSDNNIQVGRIIIHNSPFDNQIIGVQGTNYLNGDAGKYILKGGRENDLIGGGDRDDLILGGGGDDALIGRNGDDIIFGDDGHNYIFGNNGNDQLYGGKWSDIILGGKGDDLIHAAGGIKDYIDGEEGDDTISYKQSEKAVFINLATKDKDGFAKAEGGDAEGDKIRNIENIIGSNLGDTIIGNNDDNTLEGGAGDDRMVGNAGSDTYILNPDGGRDYINDDGGTVVFEQGKHGDAYLGATYTWMRKGNSETIVIKVEKDGENVNVIEFENGIEGYRFVTRSQQKDTEVIILPQLGSKDNPFMATEEVDSFSGDGNANWVSYENADSLVVVGLIYEYRNGDYARGDSFQAIDNIIGSDLEGYGDLLHGNENANHLIGLKGSDTLVGRDGADILDGGEGEDTAAYYHSDTGVVVNLATGSASGGHAQGDVFLSIENIIGSEKNDVLTGDSGDNNIDSNKGNDVINGGEGNDYIRGSSGNNILYGEQGNDGLYGGWGNDVIYGGEGNDIISGFSGNNQLDGGTGDDLLIAGVGNDILKGGEGNDQYMIVRPDIGTNTIIDKQGHNEVLFGSPTFSSHQRQYQQGRFSSLKEGDDLVVFASSSQLGQTQKVIITDYYSLPSEASFSVYYTTGIGDDYIEFNSNDIPA